MFTNYKCPACRFAEQQLPKLMDEHGFRVVYRHFPVLPQSADVARAAICADRFGRFNDMHSFLVRSEAWMKEPAWGSIAQDLDVATGDQFVACMDATDTADRLAADREVAERLMVRATPTFVGPGGMHRGLPDSRQLAKLLRN